MPNPKEAQPITVRCPNCKKTNEPNYNETAHRYACPICAAPVDAQVLVEKKKRKGRPGFGREPRRW